MLKKAAWGSAAVGLAAIFALSVGGNATSMPHNGPHYSGPHNSPPTPHSVSMDFSEAAALNWRHPTLASNSTEPVGASLVALFDVSGSMNAVEYQIQVESTAAAIESEDFRNAIFFTGGPQSIAIMVASFGTHTTPDILWVDIREGEEWKLNQLAEEIRNLPRSHSGMTYQIVALESAKIFLDNQPWESEKNIVDMITDGKENQFRGAAGEQRLANVIERLAVENGATTNALVILDSAHPDLEQWSWANLTTKPGHIGPNGRYIDAGFAKVVAMEQNTRNEVAVVEFEKAFELAFRRKLILEIAGITLDELHEQLAAADASSLRATPQTIPLPPRPSQL